MSELYDTDFVIVYKDNLEPYENDYGDITAHIYNQEAIEHFEFDGGTLESTHPNCKWLPMTELSKDNQNKYINALNEYLIDNKHYESVDDEIRSTIDFVDSQILEEEK